MPFIVSLAGRYGYGSPAPLPSILSTISTPAFYTQNTGWLMNQPGHNVTTIELKALSSIAVTSGVVRTYSSLVAAWTFIHDKDLDSNVWYGMPEGSRILSRYILDGGGTIASTLTTYTGATTSVLGASYAPAVMWSNTSYGAFIIGGFSQAVVHVLEFSALKTIANTYTVPYVSEVYGTEVVPRAASGFNCNYGVAYTRGSRQMSSWTVNMDARSWTNRTDNTYSTGVTGPGNGDGMIYYPIGKWITMNDSVASTNRIAMNDTGSARLYVWTITEGANRLNWTYLSTMTTGGNGYYPYHISSNAYNSLFTFSPITIPNLRVWLDASDLTTFNFSGSTVTLWRDKRSGYPASPTSGTFTRSGNFLTIPANGYMTITPTYTTTFRTVFTVANIGSVGATQEGYYIYVSPPAAGSSGVQVFFFKAVGNSASVNRIELNRPGGGVVYTDGGGPYFNSGTFITSIVYSSTDRSIYGNGTNILPNVNGGSAFTAGSPTTYIGGFPATTLPGFSLGELLVVDGDITIASRQQVEGYLAWKWGLQTSLPTGHPFKFSSPSVTTPVPMTNMLLWLDAADTTTIFQDSTFTTPITALSQSVGGWRDKSGNSRTYLQATSGSRPLYTTGPCVSFNTSAFHLLSTNMPAGTNNNYFFIIGKPLTTASGGWRTLFRGSNTDHPVLVEQGSTRLGTFHNGTGGFKQFGSLTLDGSARVMLEVSISASNTYTASLNNGAFTSATTAGTSDNLYALGNIQGGGQPWGEVNEILVYNGVPSTANRSTIQGYLKTKWGV